VRFQSEDQRKAVFAHIREQSPTRFQRFKQKTLAFVRHPIPRNLAGVGLAVGNMYIIHKAGAKILKSIGKFDAWSQIHGAKRQIRKHTTIPVAPGVYMTKHGFPVMMPSAHKGYK